MRNLPTHNYYTIKGTVNAYKRKGYDPLKYRRKYVIYKRRSFFGKYGLFLSQSHGPSPIRGRVSFLKKGSAKKEKRDLVSTI